MKGIKNIILDLGGVILNTNVNETLDAFRQMVKPNIKFTEDWEHLARIVDSLETGKWNKRAFIRYMKPFMRENIDKRQIIDAWCAMLEDFPVNRVKMVKALAGKYNLYLYSNTDLIHITAFEQDFQFRYGYPLEKLFLKVYYSSSIGFRKPNPEGFQLILKENSLVASETLFIDDRIENCATAESLGINTFNVSSKLGIEEVFNQL